MTKNINIDDSAHEILLWAKTQIRIGGINGPSHSDAIRYLFHQLKVRPIGPQFAKKVKK